MQTTDPVAMTYATLYVPGEGMYAHLARLARFDLELLDMMAGEWARREGVEDLYHTDRIVEWVMRTTVLQHIDALAARDAQ